MTMCLLQFVMLASRTGSQVVIRQAHRHSIAFAEPSRIHLLSGGTGVIHVVTAVIPQKEIKRK
jgi:hypothetical protein